MKRNEYNVKRIVIALIIVLATSTVIIANAMSEPAFQQPSKQPMITVQECFPIGFCDPGMGTLGGGAGGRLMYW